MLGLKAQPPEEGETKLFKTKLSRELKHFRKNKELFFLTLPAVLFVFVFSYLPIGGILLAFKDFQYNLGIFGSKWIGFTNFKFLITSNNLQRVTKNTLLMNMLFIGFTLLVSLSFAFILNEVSKRLVKVYQTIIFFPYFLSWVVVSYLVLAFLDMDFGFLNIILKQFNIEAKYWYNEPQHWPAILVLVAIWKNAGYNALIYYTALVGIDPQYYEAANLDGASRMQQIRYIAIPFITPLISILLLLSIGTIFYSDFGLFFQVTKNSQALYPTTDVLDTYVYRMLTKTSDIGMATAAGLCQSILGFITVLLSNALVNRFNPDNSLF